MSDRPMPKPKTPDPALPNEAGRLPGQGEAETTAMSERYWLALVGILSVALVGTSLVLWRCVP